MSIIVKNDRAGDPARIRHLFGRSGQALDQLWTQSWIRDSIGPGKADLRDVDTLASELRYHSDVIVVVAGGITGKMIQAALTAFHDLEEKKKVVLLGDTLSSADYANLFDLIEGRNVGLLCVATEEETLAQRAAFATMRKILTDKYGSGAERRMMVAAAPAAKYILEEAEGGPRCRRLAADARSAFAAGTEAMTLPMLAAGINAAEYLDGFREMVGSTWWDADADRYSLFLSRYAAEDILYWQTELSGLADWLAAVHHQIGIDARVLAAPAELAYRRVQEQQDPEQLSFGDLAEPDPAGEPAFVRNGAFATQLFCEHENTDIMMPAFPGADTDGSLNELLKSQARRIVNPSLRELMMGGAAQDISGINMSELTPYEFGQMMAFLQISSGITEFVRRGAE